MNQPDGKVVFQDLYVREPPAWYRRIGNGPWEPVDLAVFGGKLPVVWLKPADWVIEETWEEEKKPTGTTGSGTPQER